MSARSTRREGARTTVSGTVDEPGSVDASRLAAEQRARVRIDAQLQAAGWLVQDSGSEDLFARRTSTYRRCWLTVSD